MWRSTLAHSTYLESCCSPVSRRAVPLCGEIDSALIEEKLLDHQLRDKRTDALRTMLLRLGLRLRRFILPWSPPPRPLAVIVTSSFSAKDLLLNLLAVAFITEADDMLAMILSPAARRRPDKALEEMRQSGVVVYGMLFARFIALLCSVSIVWFVVYAEFFVNALSAGAGGVQRHGQRFRRLRSQCCSTFGNPPFSRSLGLALCNDHQVQSRPVGVERRLLQLRGLQICWVRRPGRRRDCTRRFLDVSGTTDPCKWRFRRCIRLHLGRSAGPREPPRQETKGARV